MSVNVGPNIGFLETLNTILPYIGMVVVAIVASVLFVWYTKKYTPEIARTMTKAYHSRGLPAFIQDEMGNVGFYIADKKLPEGVIHIKGKGWFLLPNPPNPEEEMPETEEARKPGRPPTKPESIKKLEEMSKEEKEEYAFAHGILVQTPILRGFGKQVFFGSSAVALSNLTAIAHADLLKVRLLAPKMYQKTQLDALATGNRLEGQKMAGKEVTKLIMYALIVIAPIAVTGLIVYLLTQRPTAGLLFGVI
jgi:hypothetical protein